MFKIATQLASIFTFLIRFLKWHSFMLMFIASCLLKPSIPTGIVPITNFELNKYLGTWYEIARLDHFFERGLKEVNATYTQKEDGSIEVSNVGTSINGKGGKRKGIVGKAKLVSKPTIGHLKVTFSWPIYSSYVIFYIESDYSVALVTSHSKKYCWILSRKPVLSPETLNKYIQILQEKGFATHKLIFS